MWMALQAFRFDDPRRRLFFAYVCSQRCALLKADAMDRRLAAEQSHAPAGGAN